MRYWLLLNRAIAERGIPGHIRSDNGPEFIAGITRQYLSENGIKTLYIEPGSPWQNGHVESFHNRLRDRTGAKSTIESTPTAISDSFPQIWLPNTGNKLNKESLVAGQATPSLHQGLLPEPTIQPI